MHLNLELLAICDLSLGEASCVSVYSALDLLFQNSQPSAKKYSFCVAVIKLPSIMMIV